MGLASALGTALTGMSAAETTIDVIGNNLANSNTVGFKASTANFATQFLQTMTLGSSPSANNGGTDPEQTGLGTMVASVTPDFSQGTISTSTTPSNLAIQGDGMFIMEGASAQQLYTRDGEFKTNANNQLVNSSGYSLLGYGVDSSFNINSTTLQPLSIPLGTATVAQATQNVILEGSLPPTGTIANEASILESGVLGDAQYSAPATAAQVKNAGVGTVPPGVYQYYITYTNSSGTQESRPSPISNPITITTGSNSNITVSVAADKSAADQAQWSSVNIYRNDSADPNTYYLVDQISGGVANGGSFTDTLDDSGVQNAYSGKTLTNFNGPPISTATLLTNLISRDATTGLYNAVFPSTGTLQFTGNKGEKDLTTQDFQVTSTSTVQDLLTFMQQALGIQSSSADPSNPIPPDSVSGLYPGGYVTAGSQLQLVGNNGTDNAIQISLSGLQFVASGTTQPQSISLPFAATQTAQGESTSADLVAYDSLGMPLSVRITCVLQQTTSSYTEYRWFADCGNNDPATGANIAVGTGLVDFDGSGNFLSASNETVSIQRAHEPSIKPMQFQLNFDNVSGLSTNAASLAVSSQDGSAPGTLSSYQIGQDGVISGVFSNGITRDLGQIVLARFANPAGLEQQGQNMYTAGVNSGLPVEGQPGTNGIGTIVGGATELSNTDVSSNLIGLITASTMYEANSRVITTTQQLFQDLLTLQH